MRLDFNVLWVDDQPDRVRAQVDAIRKHMEEEGFAFNPTLCNSVAEVRQWIGDDVFTDEIDLILVDWDLGGGVQGQTAIAEIREQVPYKDVVFYSAASAADALRRLAFESQLEGVYCASRADLVEEVIGVFDSLVKKVLDLDHARGIVMGATSDIDHLIAECLTAMHDKLDAAGKAGMLQQAVELIDARINALVTNFGKLSKTSQMADLFAAHMVFTANDRLRILSRLLADETFKAHGDARASVVTYIKDVVPGRNELGHLVIVPEGKPQAVAGSLKVLSLDETRALRRQILGLRAEFRELLAALKAIG